jgi:RNA polymerase sigma-32 factor
MTTHLDRFAATLTDERERVIWSRRLRAMEPESLSTLGEEFKVSKERVRQVEARLKNRLKAYLREALGEEIEFEFSSPDTD